ncbi:MAG: hypothetical protein ACE5EH_12835 [Gammaproteobacteria bacterium]
MFIPLTREFYLIKIVFSVALLVICLLVVAGCATQQEIEELQSSLEVEIHNNKIVAEDWRRAGHKDMAQYYDDIVAEKEHDLLHADDGLLEFLFSFF